MRTVFVVLSLVVVFSCAGKGVKVTGEAEKKAAVEEIVATVNRIFQVAKEGNLKALEASHLYGPDFSRFDHDGSRMNAEQTRASEEEFFSARDNAFQFKIVDPRVDLFSDRFAVVTYFIHYTAHFQGSDIESRDRATFVMVKDGTVWKILHENFAYLPGYPKVKN